MVASSHNLAQGCVETKENRRRLFKSEAGNKKNRGGNYSGVEVRIEWRLPFDPASTASFPGLGCKTGVRLCGDAGRLSEVSVWRCAGSTVLYYVQPERSQWMECIHRQ